MILYIHQTEKKQLLWSKKFEIFCCFFLLLCLQFDWFILMNRIKHFVLCICCISITWNSFIFELENFPTRCSRWHWSPTGSLSLACDFLTSLFPISFQKSLSSSIDWQYCSVQECAIRSAKSETALASSRIKKNAVKVMQIKNSWQ